MNITINPNRLHGEMIAPTSKSDAHRALICAALCQGSTDIILRSSNADIDATAECLKALGTGVERQEDRFKICGKAKGGGELNCGESGSTLRFLLPIAAVLGRQTTFVGSGKLPLRPMLPLTEELRLHGVNVTSDFLPITVSKAARGGIYKLAGNVSSQFVSGLLMALPLTEGDASSNEALNNEIRLTTPLESSLYADMTVKTLRDFGVIWEKTEPSEKDGHFGGYKLVGGEYTAQNVYEVEGDWSGAAFFFVLGALNGDILIRGLKEDSLQPDKAIMEIVKTVGAKVTNEDGGIRVRTGEIRPFELDVSQYPDLFPVLAVLACGADGKSVLKNAGRLRIKESDRIATTAALINSLGGKAVTGDDYMEIYGSGKLRGGKADGAGDHRIVMSAAVASVLCENSVEIVGAEAVNKSYPSFFEVFTNLGGRKG